LEQAAPNLNYEPTFESQFEMDLFSSA
jgi:hypothetical protein